MTPEHKAKLKEVREKVKAEKDAKFVSKDDFTNFQTKIIDVLQNLSDKIEAQKLPERKVMMATEPEKIGKVYAQHPSALPVVHNLDQISPEYQTIFEKYFDMTDGFKADLKGVNFRIEVPLNLSNAIDAYKDYYKKDIRHKVLDGNDIEGSMEKYCKQVCQNLHYSRRMMLKL